MPSRIAGVLIHAATTIKDGILFVLDAALNALRSATYHPIARLVLLIVGIAVVALFIVACVDYCSQGPASDQTAAEKTTTEADDQYQPQTGDLASLQLESTSLTAFTLNQNRSDVVPEISDQAMQSINDATQALTERGYTVSYVFVNLNTGMGIARDVDTKVYGASSIKGPYAAYLCSLIDQGSISRSTQCANTWVLDDNSQRNQSSYSVESLIEDMITESDNDALRFLRSAYDSYGFEQYLANMQADVGIAQEEGSFAHYTARDSAIMWMSIYQYLIQAENNENAAWLAELMSSTNLSFIRNATENNNMEAVVYNKGGWCSGSGDDYNSICDSAIVFESGTPYLLTIMTSASDGSDNEEKVTNLAAALLNTRYSLDDKMAEAINALNDATSSLNQGIKEISLSLS